MIWRSKLLSQFSELIHGCTSKSYGAIRFGYVTDEIVVANREALSRDNGIDFDRVILTEQVHGNKVVGVGSDDVGKGAKEELSWVLGADGLVTSSHDPILVVQSADCVPVFFYEPSRGIVAVAHAGWNGTIKKIVQEVLVSMQSEHNIGSQSVFCAIGPAISSKNYDISQTNDGRLAEFEAVFGHDSSVIVKSDGHVGLDLKLANKQLLLQAGVKECNIDVSDICTFEQSNEWASYRKNPDNLAYSIWSYIGLK